MSNHPELDQAIDDIVNEAITHDVTGRTVDIVTDKLKQPTSIKKKIHEEFENVLKMLNFGNLADDLFKRWYIDGRIYFQVVVDEKNPKEGIQELRYIDPRKIRKVREIKKTRDPKTGAQIIDSIAEYYIYNDRGTTTQTYTAQVNQGVRIATDSIINVNSGMMDAKNTFVISYLHKAIKPLNQLRMIEDAVVIYRLSRAPERRIFYIDVGNLPKGKAEQYLRDIMIKYRNKMVYDASTGELRDDRKHMCLVMSTKVPLLDGRILSLSEIAQEYKQKQLWAYSCDPVTGKFSPGLITWAGVSRPNAEILKITLDNGKTIECTPDHKFPVWNNGLTMAKDLQVGDSLIPFYTRNENITPGAKKNKDYEQLWKNDTKEWAFTHKLVSEWKDEYKIQNEFVFNENYINTKLSTVHHININRFDNSPENLVKMNSKDHILYHQSSSSNSGKVGGKKSYQLGVGVHNKQHPKYTEWHVNAGKIGGRISSEEGKSQNNFSKGRQVFSELMKNVDYHNWFVQQQKNGWTEEKKLIASEYAKKSNLSNRGNQAQKKLWKTEERRQKHRKLYLVDYNEQIFKVVRECIDKKLTKKQTLDILNGSNEILNSWKNINQNKCLSEKQKSFEKFCLSDINKITKIYTGNSFADLKEQTQFRNHKVVKIEFLKERFDTGCLTIDENEIYHGNHTFALEAGVYTQNSMLEDFWLPRREGGKGTEITTLPAGQNLGELEDVKYFQKKLLQSLNVPLSRLEPQQGGMIGLGRTTEVTREEVKFAKFITRLRNKFSQIFDHALRAQLVLKGVCTSEEWEDFKENIYYDYKKDNNFTELRDGELLTTRLQLLSTVDPFLGRYYSTKWVRKNVLHMTDEDIELMEKEIAQEQEKGSGQPVLGGQQEPPPSPDEYPPVDNTQDENTESDTPDLDRQVNKFSSVLNR